MGTYNKATQTAKSTAEYLEEDLSWDALEAGLDRNPSDIRSDRDTGYTDDSYRIEDPDHDVPLYETVNGLSMVVGELKAQLVHLINTNKALELDKEEAENQLLKANEKSEHYLKKMRAMTNTSLAIEDISAENRQLQQERTTLMDKLHELGRTLATSEQRLQETTTLLDQFRAERNDASAEAACLDSQFTRAMKVIEDLRNEIADHAKNETELSSRLTQIEEQKETIAKERDRFKSELLESHNALEEVRESILSASRESIEAFYKDS